MNKKERKRPRTYYYKDGTSNKIQNHDHLDTGAANSSHTASIIQTYNSGLRNVLSMCAGPDAIYMYVRAGTLYGE